MGAFVLLNHYNHDLFSRPRRKIPLCWREDERE